MRKYLENRMVKFMAKNNIEENFKELDEILEKMQDEDVSLDESFEMYKKGIEIVKDSNEQIEKIEKQIEVLEEDTEESILPVKP